MANVLITGCSSGFGLLMALKFARAGDRVVATMRQPANAPAELTGPIVTEKLPITIDRLDICNPIAVAAAVEQAGQVDVLINNAGIELRSSIEDAEDADIEKQFATNVLGTVRLIRAVLPQMRKRRAGTIVTLSSLAGIVARPYGGFYSASKHAIEAIVEALHFEVQQFGIRVVLVEPGQYATRLLDNAFKGAHFTPDSPYWETSNRFDRALEKLHPDGKLGDPQEVADLVYKIANDPSPKLRYLAGEDARTIAAAYRSMEFEAFEQMSRQMLEWKD